MSHLKKIQENLPKLQDFKEATPWVKYSIVHCQSKLVVGFVASLLEIMTDFVIYCPEIKVHTFWEGHKTVTKSPMSFELKKLRQM